MFELNIRGGEYDESYDYTVICRTLDKAKELGLEAYHDPMNKQRGHVYVSIWEVNWEDDVLIKQHDKGNKSWDLTIDGYKETVF